MPYEVCSERVYNIFDDEPGSVYCAEHQRLSLNPLICDTRSHLRAHIYSGFSLVRHKARIPLLDCV